LSARPDKVFDDSFDPEWYRARYPDVDLSGLNARVHFEKYGRLLGRPGHGSATDGAIAATDPAPARHRAYVAYEDFQGHRLQLHPRPAFDARLARASLSSAALSLPAESTPVVPLPEAPDLAVHLHLHYPELLAEMGDWLAHIPFPFHLYLSVSRAIEPEAAAATLVQRLPEATVSAAVFPNRGRDLGPFVAGFAEQLLEHEYVAHVHGKRSPHTRHKADWRRQLLVNMLGGPDLVRGVFRCFQTDPRLGMVFPSYHHSLKQWISWAGNYAVAQSLAQRMGLDIERQRLVLFPAGSVFWARSEALRPLLAAGLAFEDFPAEEGQLDGTPAHALERLLGAVVVQAGYDLLQLRADPPFTNYRYNPPETNGSG